MISRRTFIQTTMLAFASEFVLAKDIKLDNSSKSLGTVIGGVSWLDNKQKRSSFAFTDLDKQEIKIIDADFFAHTVNPNPFNLRTAIAIEKLGRGIALLDLKNKSVLKSTNSADDRVYYGHCAFSKKENSVFVSTLIKPLKNDKYAKWFAIVSELDVHTLEVKKESEVFGTAPHDLKYLSLSDSFLFPVGDGKSGRTELLQIDSTSLKIKNRIISESYLGGALAHLSFNPKGTSLVCTTNKYKPDGLGSAEIHIVDDLSGKKEFRYLNLPKELNSLKSNQLLSIFVSLDGKNLITTLPFDNMVAVIDLITGDLKYKYKISLPMGLALSKNKKYFVITAKDGYHFINTMNYEIKPELHIRNSLISATQILEFCPHISCV